MNKNHTKIILYISIFTTLLVLVIFIFLFRIIAHKNEHTSVVISTLLEKESIKSDYVEHKKKLNEIGNIKDKIYGNFVDPGQVDSLVDYLEKLGKDNGTDLSVSSIDPVRDSKSIVITVSIKGSFSKVINSISLIENSPYQVHINSIYVNKDSSVALDPKSGKAVSSSVDKWRADLSFNMLTF